jgi:glycosyltransferase involved in cell wall biosynthesis
MKRLLYVTQYYTTSSEAGGSRHYQHIQTLMRQHGYQVTVITSYVSHDVRVIPPQYQGLKIVLEQEGDLQIYKTYAYPHYDRAFGGRMLNYLSFMFLAIVAGLKAPPCDLVFATSPSLFVGLAGYILSWLKRVPLVFEVRDLWPETAVVMGALRNPTAIKLAMWLARFLYQRAERVIAVTEGIKQGIIENGAPAKKIVFVPNGVDDDLFATLSPERAAQIRQEYGWEKRFVLLYAGTLARSDGLEASIRAAASLADYKDFLLAFVGEGEVKPQLMALAEELHLSNVAFIPAQPKRRIPDFITAADVCLVPIRADGFFQMTLPNKVFDYLAGARPIIVAMPPGETRVLVERAGAGLAVPPEDEISLAAAILELRDAPQACQQYGQNGRQYALKHFLRSHLAGRLASTLDAVLQAKGKAIVHEVEGQPLSTP